jgi:hypothetical protein
MEIDSATGFFRRDAAGTFGKYSNIVAHILETADGYGLKPTAAATDPPRVETVRPALKTPVIVDSPMKVEA